ncbi:MAG: hypothetical protein [Cressdnaviricota sp.]|nr:MAG: hypothetical protein [Cressdnaviricota sp.]
MSTGSDIASHAAIRRTVTWLTFLPFIRTRLTFLFRLSRFTRLLRLALREFLLKLHDFLSEGEGGGSIITTACGSAAKTRESAWHIKRCVCSEVYKV